MAVINHGHFLDSYYKNVLETAWSAVKNAQPGNSTTLEGEVEQEPLQKEIRRDRTEGLRKIGACVYVIEQVDGDVAKTFERMRKFKSLDDRACPRLNAASPVLYVGSSSTNAAARIEQHMGKQSGKATYSLHLKHWFEGRYKIEIIPFMVDRLSLQLIEDAYSCALGPAFGKLGGNNKA